MGSVVPDPCVRADCRGRGVATALCGRLFELPIAAGDCQAFAGIALPNAASIALHESVGIRAIGVYRNVGQRAAQGLADHPVVLDKQQSHARKPDRSGLGAHWRRASGILMLS